jgi:hypothetical protein
MARRWGHSSAAQGEPGDLTGKGNGSGELVGL